MDSIFGATQEDAVSEDQQTTSPVEEENSALDSDESLPEDPALEGQEETQEDQQDTETPPGVQDRINQMRREKGDAERLAERGWKEVDLLRKQLEEIQVASVKEEIPKEQTIEYWQAIKRHSDYIDDQKVQDQCDVEIHRIVARQEIKVQSDAEDQAKAVQKHHSATYARMVAKHPQYREGTDAFNAAAKIFYESAVFQALPNGVELAINQHIVSSAPQLQEAQDSQRETVSQLKKEQSRNELGTSTRGAPRQKKATKKNELYKTFLKTGDAKELIKATMGLK